MLAVEHRTPAAIGADIEASRRRGAEEREPLDGGLGSKHRGERVERVGAVTAPVSLDGEQQRQVELVVGQISRLRGEQRVL